MLWSIVELLCKGNVIKLYLVALIGDRVLVNCSAWQWRVLMDLHLGHLYNCVLAPPSY